MDASLTPEQLDRIERRCAAVLAQGGSLVNGLRAGDVLALVQAYKKAQWVRRDITLARLDHDLERIKNAANQLPE